jgi:hypothetical protein
MAKAEVSPESDETWDESSESLDLPDYDDEVVAFDEEMADPDQACQLKADQDFQLAPHGMSYDEEDSDSGSQVVAMEDSEAFDSDAASMMREKASHASVEPAFEIPGAPAVAASIAPRSGPVMYAPAPAAKKKNPVEMIFLVIVIAVIALVIAGVVYLMAFDERTKPPSQVQRYSESERTVTAYRADCQPPSS